MTGASRIWTGVIAAALAGCATARGAGGGSGNVASAASDQSACRPVEGALPASASTSDMAGRFTVTMVATSGAQAGRTVTGTLSLLAQDSALVPQPAGPAGAGAAQPLRGTADVALEDVGAVRMGELAAADPRAPGVGVYEQRDADGRPTVVVRLGAASNARDAQPFDAGHTTFYVRNISAAGFAGGWASSAGSTYPIRRAAGYFCAVRVAP